MEKHYVELVIAAPFILAKGFLLGLMDGAGKKPAYFFSKRTGIRVETLADGLKEWLGFENLVHLCLEKSFADRFQQAVENNHEKLGIEIKSQKEIESAFTESMDHGFRVEACHSKNLLSFMNRKRNVRCYNRLGLKLRFQGLPLNIP